MKNTPSDNMPDNMPWPGPAADEAQFWHHCSEQHLMFQRCADCKTLRHPPSPLCPRCHSFAIDWIQAPQRATVYSYTVVHHPSDPVVADAVPYVVALVCFAGLGELRLVTNIIHIEPHQVRIGMPVELVWERHVEGQFLPRFRPLQEQLP